MTVLRIVANLAANDPPPIAAFYRNLFGLDVLMDHGFIVTLGNDTETRVQVSIAAEGGSGTPVPNVSIEVDDLDMVFDTAKAMGVPVEYGPVTEPWGVRRFYLRDPAGSLVNILCHA